MPHTAEKQRQARAQAAVAEGRTDFKHRAPRKRTLEDMQSRTEDAEVRARRLAELLEQAAGEVEHQKKMTELWRARAYELEQQLQQLGKSFSQIPAGAMGPGCPPYAQ